MIPRCMSTQHPDNVTVPFFASSPVLAGEDEIREAYYAFSHLGCDEQMWDVEGKDIDTHVVRKFFAFYPDYFAEHVLGEELRLTLRVPNPAIEKAEAKILLETLETIPRSTDVARLFYGREVVPIFEVILPMTTSARCIDRIYSYYQLWIVGRQHVKLQPDDITIGEWVGEFKPARIEVIPLLEDVPTMLNAGRIVEAYVTGKPLTDQRVFLARSDTAMNYGLVAAALSNKIALKQLDDVSERTGVRIHPIIGVGSAPFRGGLSPLTVEQVGREYPSVVTFTLQSAFKFDYPVEQVRAACEFLRNRPIGKAQELDVPRALDIMQRYSEVYRQQVRALAPHINFVARYVPQRRARKLHIGLFGYARGLEGVSLPRAIAFTAALYSLGLPPELLGLNALTDDDWRFVVELYPSLVSQLQQALAFADLESDLMPPELRAAIERAPLQAVFHEEHLALSRSMRRLLDGCPNNGVASDGVLRAARLRRFIG